MIDIGKITLTPGVVTAVVLQACSIAWFSADITSASTYQDKRIAVLERKLEEASATENAINIKLAHIEEQVTLNIALTRELHSSAR